MECGEVECGDGTTIVYDVAGAGPAVVFLHGLTNRRQAWEPVTSLLHDRFTCVRLDFRGHGESSAAPAYDLAALVGDLRAVVEELALDSPALVGHSLGATVAVVSAALHGARAVVCVDEPLRFGDRAAQIQAIADRLRGARPMEGVMAFERTLGLEPYERVDELQRRVLAFDPQIVRALWSAALETSPAELTEISETLLTQLTAPLLCLHGSSPPDGYPAWLAAHAPGARLEVWAGTGHLLHLVDSERFAARLVAFIDAARQPR